MITIEVEWDNGNRQTMSGIISMTLDDDHMWFLSSNDPVINTLKIRERNIRSISINEEAPQPFVTFLERGITDDDWTEKKFDEWVSNMIRDNYMHCERCRTLISGMAPPFSHDEICPNCGGPIRWVLHRSNLYDEFKPERCPDAPEDVQTPAVLPLRKLIIKDRGGAVDGA